jgi:hypothetical protein
VSDAEEAALPDQCHLVKTFARVLLTEQGM